MDAYYSDVPYWTKRHKIALWGCAAAVALLVLAVAALAALKATTPVGWTDGGQGLGPATLTVHRVDAISGSGGKDVYFASREKPGYFTVNFDLTNTARWAVRVDGAWNPSDSSRVFSLTAPAWDGSDTPLGTFWLQPGEQRYVGVRVDVPPATTCRRGQGSSTGDTVRLRLHYLRVIDDVAQVKLPFALGLVCGDLPPAYDARG